MEIIKIENLSFKYPLKDKKALNDINLFVKNGDFIVICGKSGCGKSTLLKHLKPTLTPHGESFGNIYYEGKKLKDTDSRIQASDIGFVHQSPENQIVTDKVWHELAFGLENLGYDNDIIRLRVAEMASYFGIEKWFYKEVCELSGGEKQILNLASIMAMSPKVLILDEPTSQLDPIIATEFLDTIKKINRDLGITVILSEHRLDAIFPMADRVVVMEDGKIIIDATPKEVGEFLRDNKNDMFLAMPSPMRIYTQINNNLECPITVRDGRRWLETLLSNNEILIKENEKIKKAPLGETVIELKEVWFKYEKNGPNILKDLSMQVHKGELYSLVGGNGTGKTTTLNLISGINKAYRGKVFIRGKEIGKYSSKELFTNNLGILPQNPQSLFVMKTVMEDLMEMLFDLDINEDEKKKRVLKVVETLEIKEILDMHPYDLSGGEQQKAALAKILLLNPKILLLDEPTKALDSFYKKKLEILLKKLKQEGTTIIMVTHDIEFAAKVSDTCGMFFDGSIITSGTPEKFFSENNFYTTCANKMSRDIFKAAITCEDVVKLCKRNL